MDNRRLALVTCADLPDGDPDDRRLLTPLTERGLNVDIVAWDDRSVRWDAYDLTVIRSTWDYWRRRDEFLSWVHSVPRLANGSKLIEWNTDKRYLRDLAAASVPTVPTTWLEPGDAAAVPATGEFVVKPSVGAGSNDVGRYDARDEDQVRAARRHADRLLANGQCAMVQPYLSKVDERGETALLYFGGAYSHAIEKSALLTGPVGEVDGLYRQEKIKARKATKVERTVADRAMAALPAGNTTPLYVRVDLLPTEDGPVVLEIEAVEPSLFFGYAEGAAERFAEAVVAELDGVPVPAAG